MNDGVKRAYILHSLWAALPSFAVWKAPEAKELEPHISEVKEFLSLQLSTDPREYALHCCQFAENLQRHEAFRGAHAARLFAIGARHYLHSFGRGQPTVSGTLLMEPSFWRQFCHAAIERFAPDRSLDWRSHVLIVSEFTRSIVIGYWGRPDTQYYCNITPRDDSKVVMDSLGMTALSPEAGRSMVLHEFIHGVITRPDESKAVLSSVLTKRGIRLAPEVLHRFWNEYEDVSVNVCGGAILVNGLRDFRAQYAGDFLGYSHIQAQKNDPRHEIWLLAMAQGIKETELPFTPTPETEATYRRNRSLFDSLSSRECVPLTASGLLDRSLCLNKSAIEEIARTRARKIGEIFICLVDEGVIKLDSGKITKENGVEQSKGKPETKSLGSDSDSGKGRSAQEQVDSKDSDAATDQTDGSSQTAKKGDTHKASTEKKPADTLPPPPQDGQGAETESETPNSTASDDLDSSTLEEEGQTGSMTGSSSKNAQSSEKAKLDEVGPADISEHNDGLSQATESRADPGVDHDRQQSSDDTNPASQSVASESEDDGVHPAPESHSQFAEGPFDSEPESGFSTSMPGEGIEEPDLTQEDDTNRNTAKSGVLEEDEDAIGSSGIEPSSVSDGESILEKEDYEISPTGTREGASALRDLDSPDGNGFEPTADVRLEGVIREGTEAGGTIADPEGIFASLSSFAELHSVGSRRDGDREGGILDCDYVEVDRSALREIEQEHGAIIHRGTRLFSTIRHNAEKVVANRRKIVEDGEDLSLEGIAKRRQDPDWTAIFDNPAKAIAVNHAGFGLIMDFSGSTERNGKFRKITTMGMVCALGIEAAGYRTSFGWFGDQGLVLYDLDTPKQEKYRRLAVAAKLITHSEDCRAAFSAAGIGKEKGLFSGTEAEKAVGSFIASITKARADKPGHFHGMIFTDGEFGDPLGSQSRLSDILPANPTLTWTCLCEHKVHKKAVDAFGPENTVAVELDESFPNLVFKSFSDAIKQFGSISDADRLRSHFRKTVTNGRRTPPEPQIHHVK